jgi:hypothetical protein
MTDSLLHASQSNIIECASLVIAGRHRLRSDPDISSGNANLWQVFDQRVVNEELQIRADDLLRVTAAQVKLTDWVVDQDAGSRLLGAISGKPLSLWQDYADLVPERPDVQWLRTSVAAGNAGLGLLGADVLESDLDEELLQATVKQVELEVLVASEPGRLRAARELYARLEAIDPTVPVRRNESLAAKARYRQAVTDSAPKSLS